jgi:hypothetical protein
MSEFASEGSQAADEQVEHVAAEPNDEGADALSRNAGETEDVPRVEEN